MATTNTQYIFTADDFGPINFINQGIYQAVKQGLVNSVQVLTNGDSVESLATKLGELAKCVGENQKLDLGLHLTLTSGKPIEGGDWGEMLEGKNFKGFNKFHFGYASKIDLIKKEFAAQKKRLDDALTKLNSNKLVLSSISNHHNMMAIGKEIFEAYLEIGQKHNLSFRSLKAIPAFSMWMYYKLVLPGLLIFGNKSDKKIQRKTMHKMNKAFKKTQHFGDKDFKLKSPSYLDAGFYSALGSKFMMKKLKGKKIIRRSKKLGKMIDATLNQDLHVNISPAGTQVVEFVFHIGNKNNFKQNYSTFTKEYSGVTPLYFDNRILEFKALETIKKNNSHNYAFDNFVSWNDCGTVTYKQL